MSKPITPEKLKELKQKYPASFRDNNPNSITATTGIFRASYPNLFKARKNDQNGKMQYGICALFEKADDMKVLQAIELNACKKKWGEDKTKWPKNFRRPFKDQGDVLKKREEDGKPKPDGYEAGAVYLNLTTEDPPGVAGLDGSPMADSSEFYPGCYARAIITASAYDMPQNKGVSFYLNLVQKVADGKPFGNRIEIQNAFQPIAVEGESDTAVSTSDMFAGFQA